ncbi:MAG: hypothetical protein ACPGZP_04690 [Panacagrimonas sp.]
MSTEHQHALTPEERRTAEHLRTQMQRTEALDAVRSAKLNAARRKAVEAARAPSTSWRPGLMRPVAATVAVAVIASMGFQLWNHPPAPSVESGALEWLVLSEDDPELYENLEFYEWLNDEVGRSG